MQDIDKVWEKIEAHEGCSFKTKTGQSFSYEITGNILNPSSTEYNLSKSEFAKALKYVPIEGPGKISSCVRGPSYIWAILHDDRICQGEW